MQLDFTQKKGRILGITDWAELWINIKKIAFFFKLFFFLNIEKSSERPGLKKLRELD